MPNLIGAFLPFMSSYYSIIDGRAAIQMPCAFGQTHRVQTLSHFFESYFRDKYLVQFCLDNGYLPFGGAANGGYDPVCFDCNKGSSTDRPVVQLCHESILVGHRIKVVKNLFPTFESLVLSVISDNE